MERFYPWQMAFCIDLDFCRWSERSQPHRRRAIARLLPTTLRHPAPTDLHSTLQAKLLILRLELLQSCSARASGTTAFAPNPSFCFVAFARVNRAQSRASPLGWKTGCETGTVRYGAPCIRCRRCFARSDRLCLQGNISLQQHPRSPHPLQFPLLPLPLRQPRLLLLPNLP